MTHENEMRPTEAISILEELFEPLPTPRPDGKYDPITQTWEHREWLQFTPVKHNQEA